MVPKHGRPSRGPPIVIVQDATEPFSALDCAVHVAFVDQPIDQLVVEPLVIALKMVVLRVYRTRFLGHTFELRRLA